MPKYDDMYEEGIHIHKGYKFLVRCHYDPDYGPPWDQEDGHGPVSDWVYRDKLPGERVLMEHRSCRRYYDFQEAVRIAKRDQWGISSERRAELERKQGRELTPGEVASEAAWIDFEAMRDWCENRWWYAWISVVPLDDDGNEIEELEQTLGGVADGLSPPYSGGAHEAARELMTYITCIMDKEAREAQYWAQRDVPTLA